MPDPDFHKSIENEADLESRLVQPRRGPSKPAMIILFALITIPVLATPLWFNRSASPESLEKTAEEDLLPPPAHVKIDVPPPPELPPQVEEKAPAAPEEQSGDAAELARKLAEAEDARRAAEAERLANESENDEKRWERYRSPMVISETGQPNDAMAPGEPARNPDEAEKSTATFQDANPNGQFLAAMAAKPVEVAKAEQNKRIDALVPQGTMIRGVLETAVQTDLPGMVRAVTTEDVWSFDGRRVLLPAGTRMIGEYNAGVEANQKRAFIVWNRVLRADGVSLNLGSIGTDELGRSGSAGDVNNHYLAKYGTAILLSTLSLGAQAAADTGSRAVGTGPITTQIYDPVTQKTTVNTINPNNAIGTDLGNKALSAAAQGLTQVAQEGLKSSMSIKPTISINQGTPVAIFVRGDLDFSDLYPDPVKEKLKELKRGHGWYEK